ncbi:MAG: hypothetical protein BRC29_04140 [Nanohaloarchaea archaeon SW_7_43_1]|nr:MAG: hypothetical protein BRC29_04140 [Nanohaloarchaea archaeon SW_7_43_1]
MREDFKILYAIKQGANEIKYNGSTKVDGYRHNYTVLGGNIQQQMPSGTTKMIVDDEKAEYQPVNNRRGILRTSQTINDLLTPEEGNNGLP